MIVPARPLKTSELLISNLGVLVDVVTWIASQRAVALPFKVALK
jgi:hypothetical protein